ncbi:MAG: hypothetical protein IJH91_00340 [Mogibacterium sp.]|nr:hypothetical protein [Mogibacterium sp.]
MDTLFTLSQLKKAAAGDRQLRESLLASRQSAKPLKAFCEAARAHGFDLYEMDLIEAGADHYAAMKRSQNGGGENSPVLNSASDYYEAFVEELGKME